jgi:ParB family chromosome partitioning protein
MTAMVKRQTLGRGLSALFGEDEAAADDGGETTEAGAGTGGGGGGRGVRLIPIDRLAPSPLQPRRVFDEAGLDELAESLRARGVL